MNLETICSKYPILLNYGSIQELIDLKEPIVTIAMLSYRRPKSLIKTLKQLLSNGTPLNLCLNVQGQEELSDDIKEEIEGLVCQFYNYLLDYSDGNLGSGIPRHRMLHEALKLNTPYLMFTDDDMHWKPNSIVAQISVLESLPESYAGIGSVCTPFYPAYFYKEGKITQKVIDTEFMECDLMGSGTSIFKSHIFEKCDLDVGYNRGLQDFDHCMNIRSNGWQLGIMNIPELWADNNAFEKNNHNYTQERYNKEIIQKSRERFKNKWGM